jgi:hypothetical protein
MTVSTTVVCCHSPVTDRVLHIFSAFFDTYEYLTQPLHQVPEALADTQPLVLRLLRSVRQRLLLLQLLVQLREHEPEPKRSQDRDAEHGGDNPVARTVRVRLIEPDIRADDVAGLTESIDQSDRYCAFCGRTREGRADP